MPRLTSEEAAKRAAEETNVYGTPEERAEAERESKRQQEKIGNLFEVPYLSFTSYKDNELREERSKIVTTPGDGVRVPFQPFGPLINKQQPPSISTPPSPTSAATKTNAVYAKDINKFDVLESIPSRKDFLGVSHEQILNKKQEEINNNKQELSKKKEDNAVELASNKNTASKSRTRMGLFGNYGKDVEIRKTSDETTGKVNREKLVDGKVVKSRFETKEFKDSRKRGNENKKYAKSVNKYDAKYDKKANKK